MKRIIYLSKMLNADKGDDEYVIIESYPSIKYTLIRRNTVYEPWIAAYNYDEKSETWQQGHYFQTIKDAGLYIAEVTEERYEM